MTPREKGTCEAALEWIGKAEEDFGLAQRGLSEDPFFPSPAAFLSQQCAEKYLKAFMTAHQVEFPKTHDIRALLELVASVDEGLAEALVDARKLTPYGVDVRYPGDFPGMSPALARKAVDLASKVRDAVREALGEEYLRRGEPPK